MLLTRGSTSPSACGWVVLALPGADVACTSYPTSSGLSLNKEGHWVGGFDWCQG